MKRTALALAPALVFALSSSALADDKAPLRVLTVERSAGGGDYELVIESVYKTKDAVITVSKVIDDDPSSVGNSAIKKLKESVAVRAPSELPVRNYVHVDYWLVGSEEGGWGRVERLPRLRGAKLLYSAKKGRTVSASSSDAKAVGTLHRLSKTTGSVEGELVFQGKTPRKHIGKLVEAHLEEVKGKSDSVFLLDSVKVLARRGWEKAIARASDRYVRRAYPSLRDWDSYTDLERSDDGVTTIERTYYQTLAADTRHELVLTFKPKGLKFESEKANFELAPPPEKVKKPRP